MGGGEKEREKMLDSFPAGLKKRSFYAHQIIKLLFLEKKGMKKGKGDTQRRERFRGVTGGLRLYRTSGKESSLTK